MSLTTNETLETLTVAVEIIGPDADFIENNPLFLLEPFVALTLSAEPNNFWRELFFACWTEAIRKDVAARGAEIPKNLTDQQRRDEIKEIIKLENRLRNPREGFAPSFLTPTLQYPTPRLVFHTSLTDALGGITAYVARVVEVVAVTNANISTYLPLTNHLEAEKSKQRAREIRAQSIANLVAKAKAALVSKDLAASDA